MAGLKIPKTRKNVLYSQWNGIYYDVYSSDGKVFSGVDFCGESRKKLTEIKSV